MSPADFHRLHAAARRAGHRPGYVLLRGKRPFQRRWNLLYPSAASVERHLARGGQVGLRPVTVGAAVVDVDGPEWRGLVAAHPPAVAYNTSGPDRAHLLYAHPGADVVVRSRGPGLAGLPVDLRGCRGQVLLWAAQPWIDSLAAPGATLPASFYKPPPATPVAQATYDAIVDRHCGGGDLTAALEALMEASGTGEAVAARIANHNNRRGR